MASSTLAARPCRRGHLGVGVGTLNKLRSYGGGPLYSKMMAGVVAYDIADLDAWATEAQDLQYVRACAGRLTDAERGGCGRGPGRPAHERGWRQS